MAVRKAGWEVLREIHQLARLVDPYKFGIEGEVNKHLEELEEKVEGVEGLVQALLDNIGELFSIEGAAADLLF